MTLDDRLEDIKGISESEHIADWAKEDGYEKSKLAILADLETIIGEETKPDGKNLAKDLITRLRNEIRAELRDKVKEYCK